MKTLVIGDIHNLVDGIEDLISRINPEKVIFLGDYFDSFYDDRYIAEKTANWLLHSLKQENRIHLIGNHDIAYMFPGNIYLKCPGFTSDKSRTINSLFARKTKEFGVNPWTLLKLAYFDHEHNFIFSHAGLSEHIFRCCPILGPNLKQYEEDINLELEKLRTEDQYISPISGREGIFWVRHLYFNLIPDVTQVVGHTPTSKIQNKKYSDSTPLLFSEGSGKLYNIDCAPLWVGLYEDGKFSCVSGHDHSIIWEESITSLHTI